MRKKQFLPFLTDDQGRTLAKINGMVQTTPTPNPIDESPEGWEDNTIQYSRNNELKGLLVTFITNLIFYFEGASILRDYFYNKGTESTLYFIWLKLNQVFGGGMRHEDYYKGQPDFSTFKDGSRGVQINIVEGGMYRDYTANKNLPYEYPFKDDPAAVSIEWKGMVIEQKTSWLITNGDGMTPNNGQHVVDLSIITDESINSVDTASEVRRHFVDINDAADITGNSQYFHKTGAAVGNLAIDFSYQTRVTLATGISPNPVAGSALVIRGYDADTNTYNSAWLLKTFGGASNLYNVVWNLSGTVTLANVPANTKLYLMTVLTLSGVVATAPGTYIGPGGASFVAAQGSTADQVVFWEYFVTENSLFKMRYNYLFKDSVVKAFRVFDVGDKLVRSMSNGRSVLQSNLLNNDFNLLVTNGDALRGIEDAKLKTKWNDWKKSVDAVKCIAASVKKNNMVVESRYDYFTNTEIANLGEAKIPDYDFITTANEYKFSSAEVGYPDTNTQSINGRFSFNNTSIWNAPVKTITNVYDAKSVYQADPFVMELIRINTEGKTTTDNQSDNTCFFVDAEAVHNPLINQSFEAVEGIGNPYFRLIGVTGLNLMPGTRFRITTGQNAGSWVVFSTYETGGDTYIFITGFLVDETSTTDVLFDHYRLRRKSYVSIEGVPSPSTVFNLELSPATIFRNHWRWFHSGLDHAENSVLTYQTTEKNDKLVRTDAAGVVIREREDIPISSLGDKVYIPYYLNFQVKSPYNLKGMMDANSTGYFEFAADKTFYQGFPEDIKSNDATLAIQDYRLLATINNDFTKRAQS